MFDWNEYLKAAKKLEREDSECSKRIAISRAYYAAFNITKKKRIFADSDDFNGAGSHNRMWNMAFPDDSEIRIRDDALTLKDWRVEADYKNNIYNVDRQAKLAIRLAEKIINYVSSN